MVQVGTIVKGGLKIAKYGGKIFVKFLPEILTAVGTAAVVAGVVETAKVAPDAKVALDEVKDEWEAIEDKEKRVKADYIFKRIRVGMKHYWIVVLIIGGAITCFWLSNRISFKRLMSALTAAGLSAKAKEEFEEKVKELYGDKQVKKIKDEIDADRIKNNPPVESEIIHTGYGMHLCYEPITGRYFYSNIERIKRALIDCKAQLQADGYLGFNDWNCALGLDSVDLPNLCWLAESKADVNEFEVTFSSQITPEGTPCLAIHYSVNPIMELIDY